MDRFIPDAAAVHGLLGKLHRANGDVRKAAEAYAQALRADAFMWDAFTDLCDSGPSTISPRSSSVTDLHRCGSSLVKYLSASVVIHQASRRNYNRVHAGRFGLFGRR